MSQVDLARAAGVSQRHISFLETGRSRPSRDMAARLAEALRVPLDEHNAMLLAAELAPVYPVAPLGEIVDLDESVTAYLLADGPWPSVVVDRAWRVVRANQPFARLLEIAFRDGSPWRREENLMRLILSPTALTGVAGGSDRFFSSWMAMLASDAAEHPHDADLVALAGELVGGEHHPSGGVPVTAVDAVAALRLGADAGDLDLFTIVGSIPGGGTVIVSDLRFVTFVPLGERSLRRWGTSSGAGDE